MGRVIAYYALHYGAEHLAWSIRSIQDCVDEIHVLYTDVPSFGHQTTTPCPESETDLKREADRFRTKPLHWHKGRWPTEGSQRNAIFPIAQGCGADVIVVVDADEIWEGETLKAAVKAARESPAHLTYAGFIHLWRSFKWCCEDQMTPIRLIKPDGHGNAYLPAQRYPVFHLGYAQSPKLIRYKESIHGHRSEWRSGWFESKFMAWSPTNPVTDVHPTCKDIWSPHPIDVDKGAVLRRLMDGHPWLDLEIIP